MDRRFSLKAESRLPLVICERMTTLPLRYFCALSWLSCHAQLLPPPPPDLLKTCAPFTNPVVTSKPSSLIPVNNQYYQSLWNLDATVGISLHIDEHGAVSDLRVVSNTCSVPLIPGHLTSWICDTAAKLALNYVSKWTFRPATNCGRPVASVATTTVDFGAGQSTHHELSINDPSNKLRAKFYAIRDRNVPPIALSNLCAQDLSSSILTLGYEPPGNIDDLAQSRSMTRIAVLVDPNGQSTKLEVIDVLCDPGWPFRKDLPTVAMDWIRQWKFKPEMHCGSPVASEGLITITFGAPTSPPPPASSAVFVKGSSPEHSVVAVYWEN